MYDLLNNRIFRFKGKLSLAKNTAVDGELKQCEFYFIHF